MKRQLEMDNINMDMPALLDTILKTLQPRVSV